MHGTTVIQHIMVILVTYVWAVEIATYIVGFAPGPSPLPKWRKARHRILHRGHDARESHRGTHLHVWACARVLLVRMIVFLPTTFSLRPDNQPRASRSATRVRSPVAAVVGMNAATAAGSRARPPVDVATVAVLGIPATLDAMPAAAPPDVTTAPPGTGVAPAAPNAATTRSRQSGLVEVPLHFACFAGCADPCQLAVWLCEEGWLVTPVDGRRGVPETGLRAKFAGRCHEAMLGVPSRIDTQPTRAVVLRVHPLDSRREWHELGGLEGLNTGPSLRAAVSMGFAFLAHDHVVKLG